VASADQPPLLKSLSVEAEYFDRVSAAIEAAFPAMVVTAFPDELQTTPSVREHFLAPRVTPGKDFP